jgi:hypothetical protein
MRAKPGLRERKSVRASAFLWGALYVFHRLFLLQKFKKKEICHRGECLKTKDSINFFRKIIALHWAKGSAVQ